MKVYPYLSVEGFSNCYLVANEETQQAILIDPGTVSAEIIETIENQNFTLDTVLITHAHKSHYSGLETLLKIYSPKIFAAEYEISGIKTESLHGDGILNIAGLEVKFIAMPGHSSDSVIFQIGEIIFSGDSIFAGRLGKTANLSFDFRLQENILKKILNQNENLILMPGHGPPSTIAAEKSFNLSLGCPLIISQLR